MPTCTDPVTCEQPRNEALVKSVIVHLAALCEPAARGKAGCAFTQKAHAHWSGLREALCCMSNAFGASATRRAMVQRLGGLTRSFETDVRKTRMLEKIGTAEPCLRTLQAPRLLEWQCKPRIWPSGARKL